MPDDTQQYHDAMEWKQNEYTLNDSREDLDVAFIHRVLRESYWAADIPQSVVEAAIDHSLCFGLYRHTQQIGFGRAITDRSTFAYLADVFIVPAHQKRGLGKWMIACMRAHPELQGLRRWLLATRDAHGLYAQQGFTALRHPDWFMEINDPGIYRREGR